MGLSHKPYITGKNCFWDSMVSGNSVPVFFVILNSVCNRVMSICTASFSPAASLIVDLKEEDTGRVLH